MDSEVDEVKCRKNKNKKIQGNVTDKSMLMMKEKMRSDMMMCAAWPCKSSGVVKIVKCRGCLNPE